MFGIDPIADFARCRSRHPFSAAARDDENCLRGRRDCSTIESSDPAIRFFREVARDRLSANRMEDAALIVFYTTAAGACIPVGALLGGVERFRPRWLERDMRHGVIAFGGGVLVGAVALVLVPEGVSRLAHPAGAAISFVAGGVCFFFVERFLGLRRRETPQLAAMLLDYIPESLALGGMFAAGSATAPLLAALIGLQNLPEGFNAFRELNSKHVARPTRIYAAMCALVPLGPILGLLGWSYLAQHNAVLGGIMLFSAGGILYLIFQDIAPQSRLNRHWAPPLGAILGFGVGLIGRLVVNAT